MDMCELCGKYDYVYSAKDNEEVPMYVCEVCQDRIKGLISHVMGTKDFGKETDFLTKRDEGK